MNARVPWVTPLSHVSRKARMVLLDLGLACEFAYARDLPSADPGH